MSRKNRRHKAAVERSTRRILAEGQGVVQWTIIMRENWSLMLLAAASGDQYAINLCALVTKSLRRACHSEPPLPCLLCPNTFAPDRLPEAFVTVMADRPDEPGTALVNCLCDACAAGDDLPMRIAAEYREKLFPDLRMLPPQALAGRA
jgi:hypothetical protein